MSTLLRKVKSTINAATLDPHSDTVLANKFVTRSRLQKVQPEWRPETLLPDPTSFRSNNPTPTLSRDRPDQHHQHHPLTEFRRRLARKASTFSLRTKRWKAELKDQEQEQEKKDKEYKANTPGPHKREPLTPLVAEIGRGQESGLHNESDSRFHLTSDTESRPVRSPETAESKPAENKNRPGKQEATGKKQQGSVCLGQEGGNISTKMASEHTAAPPVPYTRLKEITESACEAALAGVKAYSHPDTESWNTAIINSILGALVEETSQNSASGSAPSQPQFKYVVNSTIIQHAAAPSSSGDDAKKTSGRRGMHAASGAYWNNEKDGMWSYKYPGADSKGLDVVIGVIWIWVG